MKKTLLTIIGSLALAAPASAAWYTPSQCNESKSIAIDQASDLYCTIADRVHKSCTRLPLLTADYGNKCDSVKVYFLIDRGQGTKQESMIFKNYGGQFCPIYDKKCMVKGTLNGWGDAILGR